MSAGVQAQESEGLQVGGFVDAQYEWRDQKNLSKLNSFSVNDGAVYLGKKIGMGEVMVDIPFRSRLRTELVDSAGNSTDNSDLILATSKAQAYVGWKYENGFAWRMGQFDALYGFEAFDTVDLQFSRSGLLTGTFPVALTTAPEAILPTVHRGLVTSYSFSDLMGIDLLVSNPSDKAVMTEHNPDFGGRVRTKFDIFHASLGALYNRQGPHDGYLYDLLAGTSLQNWAFDIEATLDRKPVGSAKTRWASLLNVSYSVSEKLRAGTRVEYSKKDREKFMSLTVGPQYSFSKELTAKLDWTLAKADVNGRKDSAQAVYLSAIFRF